MANYTSQWDSLQTGKPWPEWRAVHTQRYTYVKWLSGKEELYDNTRDPYQMANLAGDKASASDPRSTPRLPEDLAGPGNDDFRPGNDYGEWYDNERNLIRTGLGPVAK